MLHNTKTLKDLIDTLGPVKKAEKTPTSRKLREEAGEPIVTTDSILIYACGYAVYENESGRTVMWVPACTSFTYYFDKETELERTYIPQKCVLPECMLEALPWEMVLTMIGDHRIEANSMNRAGSRGIRAALESEETLPFFFFTSETAFSARDAVLLSAICTSFSNHQKQDKG